MLNFKMVFLDIIPDIKNISDDESRLIKYLLNFYEIRSRPVLKSTETVQVELALNMMKLFDIDTKLEIISISGWITVIWYDKHLYWNNTEFRNIDYVSLLPQDVWLPSFVLGNTVDNNMYNKEWYTLHKVRVMQNGMMRWTPGGKFKVNCPMDVLYFPFDEQICIFLFENWIYTGKSFYFFF